MIAIILKHWKLGDKRLAAEMLRQFGRGVARDMSAKSEGMQLMIDLVREDSKVSQPFTVAQIVDYSFLENARRDLNAYGSNCRSNEFLTWSRRGYTFGDTRRYSPMAKALSLKLDDSTYAQAEQIRKRLKLPRNLYIRKAVSHYNSLYARRLLETEYRKASRRLGAAHLDYLKETELLEDLPEDL